MATYRAEKIVRIPKNPSGSSALHFQPGEEIPADEAEKLTNLAQCIKDGLISKHETTVDMGSKPAPATSGKQK